MQEPKERYYSWALLAGNVISKTSKIHYAAISRSLRHGNSHYQWLSR
jgi:hypothetical protein